MYNYYIASLQGLRRAIDNRIDSEIEEAMRKRGDSEKLKDSLRYIIEDDNVLAGRLKKYETMGI